MTNIITGQASPDNVLPLLEREHIMSFFAPLGLDRIAKIPAV